MPAVMKPSNKAEEGAARPRSIARRVFAILLQIVAGFLVISLLATLALRWVPPFTTAVMLERRAQSLFAGRGFGLDYRWVPLEKISPHAPLAVIAAEDQEFAAHFGFDFKSIQKAIDAHERGRRLRGASTISQQVAKNVFLWSGRSLVRKGLEAYFTVLIEFTWPKRRILEVYLNIAEMGDGVFGVEAASRRYFGKPAARLSAGDAALLAAVLPNPHRLRAARPSAYVLSRRDWILDQMNSLGPDERRFSKPNR